MKNSIIHFWDRYKGYIVPLSLVLCVLILFPHVAHAEGAAPATAPTGNTVQLPSTPDADAMYRDVARFLSFVMGFLQKLIWPVLLLIGGLMKNDILFGAGMEDRMLEIWANVRNIVNILFVLLLLGIAFYNVVGGKNEALHLKQALPKFVIGLIAVNFSFLGVKVIIDTVNIVSTAIFAMPDAVQEGLGKNDLPNMERKICEGIYGKKPAESKKLIDFQNKTPGSAFCEIKSEGNMILAGKAKEFFSRYDGNNAAIVMAINLGKISEYDKVDIPIQDIKNLATQTIFSVGLYIAFASAFIALFCVLLVRMIVLWVTIVLSPFMVLAYVLPENLKSHLGGAGEMQKKFVQTAIIPIPIAIMMTIGFMMLKGLQSSSSTSITLSSATLGAGFLTSGLSTFQDVIIAVGTIGVIWMGVFESMKGTYADHIVEKIKGGVEGAGKFAMSAIQYAPIFPVAVPGEKGGKGGFENMSLATGLGVAERLPQALRGIEDQKSQKIIERMLGQKAFEAEQQARDAKDGKALNQALANSGGRPSKNLQRITGDQLGLNPVWQTKFDFGGLTDAQGKSLTQGQFIGLLKKGDVPDDTFNTFIQNSNRKENVRPEASKEKPGEAGKGAAAQPAISGADASGMIGAAGAPYIGALKKEEKDALDAFKNAQAGKDEKKKQETLVAAQDALGKLKGLAESGIGTEAAYAKTTEQLDKLITDRRKVLTGQGMSSDDANKAIAGEIKLVLSDPTRANITNGSEAAVIRAVAPVAAAEAKKAEAAEAAARPKVAAAAGKPASTTKTGPNGPAPNNPNKGDKWQAGNVTKTWDGGAWR